MDHVIAQVIEAELIVGPVSDVGLVRPPPFRGPRFMTIDHVNRKA